jgi:hypothetical protein
VVADESTIHVRVISRGTCRSCSHSSSGRDNGGSRHIFTSRIFGLCKYCLRTLFAKGGMVQVVGLVFLTSKNLCVRGDLPPMLRFHEQPIHLFKCAAFGLWEEHPNDGYYTSANCPIDDICLVSDLGKADGSDLGNNEVKEPMGLLMTYVLVDVCNGGDCRER